MARCRFGKFLRVAENGKAPDVVRLVKDFPAKRERFQQGELMRGLVVRLAVQCDASDPPLGAVAELQLGEAARFYPTNAALAVWRAQAPGGFSSIIYE